MVGRARQVAVAPGAVLEEERDHFRVGRAVKHLALVTFGETQHLRAVGVVTAGLAPQGGRLDGGHQQLERARAILPPTEYGRSAERRGGKELVRTCSSRWAPYTLKKH